MAKKKLLNEAQVRRFMGLAGIKPIGLNESAVYEDEEAAPEVAPEADPEMDATGGEVKDTEAAIPAEEPEAEEETVELEQEDVDALADLAEKLPNIVAKLQGEPEMDAEAAIDDEPAIDDVGMDMGGEAVTDDADAADLDLDADEEEEAAGDDEGVIAEALRGVNLQTSEKELVNEVARRVAKRILKAKRAQKELNEALGRKKRK